VEEMTAAVLRKELHTIIDTRPDRSLPALKPLLTHLADEYCKPVTEPASPDERAMIDEGMAEYRKDPSSFVTLLGILTLVN